MNETKSSLVAAITKEKQKTLKKDSCFMFSLLSRDCIAPALWGIAASASLHSVDRHDSSDKTIFL